MKKKKYDAPDFELTKLSIISIIAASAEHVIDDEWDEEDGPVE